MIVFGDTSGFFALLVHDDFMHVRAKRNFDHFAAHDVQLATSSYVLLKPSACCSAASAWRPCGISAVSSCHCWM